MREPNQTHNTQNHLPRFTKRGRIILTILLIIVLLLAGLLYKPASPDPPVPPGLECPTTSTCAYHAVNAPSGHGDAWAADQCRLDHVPR